MNEKPDLKKVSNVLVGLGSSLLVLAFCVAALGLLGLCIWAWLF